MTATLIALLDGHDALVQACLDGVLTFPQFAAAYGDFPAAVVPVAAREQALQQRIAFHRQVAGVLDGASQLDALIEPALTLRLKMLTARHPNFSCPG